ncbi:hypothetical protein GDO81_023550 [Engystomops pustulosus]|uniref:Uncharacterized protein n=1 Tax=Engystomops pustulosus TaxID=76066 RepID=A0AAV6YLX0_ENGPU|nr:hypothetical protein GDO81_023550 [Engystomops pustulosus]
MAFNLSSIILSFGIIGRFFCYQYCDQPPGLPCNYLPPQGSLVTTLSEQGKVVPSFAMSMGPLGRLIRSDPNIFGIDVGG